MSLPFQTRRSDGNQVVRGVVRWILRLTFKFQGLDQRLTGVDRKVCVVKSIFA